MYLKDRYEAERLLEWASKENPGRWVDHSRFVAKAAERMAQALVENGYEIDPEIAYIAGILHDIGRYKGFSPSVIHSYDGYLLLKKLGYVGNATICVTHSFPIGTELIEAVNGWDQVPEWMQRELINILKQIDWTMYDKVLTLSDAIADTNGFTIIERRLVSVAIRNGTSVHVPTHWRGFFQIKQEIEAIIGCSVYQLFPGIESSIYEQISLEN
ncbi:hypothetical protein JOC54_003981 [Alkalihalobacillus xiaoxiensis]|uniref:HD/PDEase domain-containing protein n=1 Tax=Shouchella xiaoxiensis TaxID=766895 RepID=A0ABS2SYT3_9BACI|nr:HD domain-containing protein [Shouchella xiaoxiensis]MBM7840688.1 hypothetical protein [Shouchella xiaoxiensis]